MWNEKFIVINWCVHGEQTYPPSRAILRLSLNTGFKMYPCRPPCSCWLCQRRSPANTETHSSWSLQPKTKYNNEYNSWMAKNTEDLVQPNTYKDTLHKECNTGPALNKSPEISNFHKQNVQLMLVKLCVCVCVLYTNPCLSLVVSGPDMFGAFSHVEINMMDKIEAPLGKRQYNSTAAGQP